MDCFSYALLFIVRSVPITPTDLFLVAAAAVLAPGFMTPITGTGEDAQVTPDKWHLLYCMQ